MRHTATDIILGIVTFAFIIRFGLFLGLLASFGALVWVMIMWSIVSSRTKQ